MDLAQYSMWPVLADWWELDGKICDRNDTYNLSYHVNPVQRALILPFCGSLRCTSSQNSLIPLSKRIIRDTSSEPPFKDDFGLACGAYRTWENVSMQNTMKAVDKGESVRRAAELYNVPRSTLHDRVSGKVMHGARSGPQPYLSIEEEEALTNFFLETAKIGYAHTRK